MRISATAPRRATARAPARWARRWSARRPMHVISPAFALRARACARIRLHPTEPFVRPACVSPACAWELAALAVAAERAERREALPVAALAARPEASRVGEPAARPEASRVGEPVARPEAFLAGALRARTRAACLEAAQAASQEWLAQLDQACLEAAQAVRPLAQAVPA